MNVQKHLTAKQQNFTDFILDRCSQADAYRNDYTCANISYNAIRVEASRFVNNPCVALTVAEKWKAIQTEKMWARQPNLVRY